MTCLLCHENNNLPTEQADTALSHADQRAGRVQVLCLIKEDLQAASCEKIP